MSAAAGRWYRDGLCFECTACGRCCTGAGEHDTVYVNRHEERALARFLGLAPAEFRAQYTVLNADGDRVLRSRGTECVLLAGNRCTAYPARPVQCRTWPFWPENLATPVTWRAVEVACPGAGAGGRHPPGTIGRALRALERADRGDAVRGADIPDLSPPVPSGGETGSAHP